MTKPDTKSLLTWLDSLPAQERDELLKLYTKQLVKARESKPKPKPKEPSVHPEIAAILSEMETFRRLHAEVIKEWQRLEATLQATRAKLIGRYKVYERA